MAKEWFNNSQYNTQLEWNSNSFVIKRFNDGILNELIIAKREANLSRTLDILRDFYMEICADLGTSEHEVWQKIIKLRMMDGNYGGDSPGGYAVSEGIIWAVADEVERELRLLAKKHGYLASNKDDPRRAITER